MTQLYTTSRPDQGTWSHSVDGVHVVTFGPGLRRGSLYRVLATLEYLDPNDPDLTRKSDRIAREKAMEGPPRIAVMATNLTVHGAVNVAQEALGGAYNNPETKVITTWVEETP